MKDILTSPRMEDIKRKRKAYRVRLSVLILILVISIIGALGYFSSNSKITINDIGVTGPKIINSKEVESTTRQILSGKYLHLFAKNNSLIYPKSKIYNELLIDYPRIDKLSVYKDGWNTLKIDITERAGSYLYCGSQIPELESEIGENCYFINNDGYIFDKAPYFSGNVYFKYYAPLPAGTDLTSTQMIEPSHFHLLVRFIDGIIGLGFKPTHLVITGENVFLYLDHSIIDTEPQIIFKDGDNLDEVLNNLSLSMAKPEFASDIHSKYTSLLYIDLRFKNKVLYKFQ